MQHGHWNFILSKVISINLFFHGWSNILGETDTKHNLVGIWICLPLSFSHFYGWKQKLFDTTNIPLLDEQLESKILKG